MLETQARSRAQEQVSWLEKARANGPMIDAAASRDEQATQLSQDVVHAIDEAGLFAIMVPAELGGGEAHPGDVIDAISELSYWDGSAGWYSHAVMTGGAVAGAYLGPRAAEAIFPGGHFVRAAGQAAPTGKAVREGDGFRISGRYSFGSGTPHAGFVVGGFMVQEGGKPATDENGQPVMLIGLCPKERTRQLGNWNVLGLRGTGSYDFEVMDQQLHEDFFDEWRSFARAKSRGAGLASDLNTFQLEFANATADLHAADAYVRSTFSTLYDAATSGSPTAQMRLEGQLATSHAFTVAKRIARVAFDGCTTRAVRDGNPIQRCIRDIMAGSAHVLNSEQALIDAGKMLGGDDDAGTPLTRDGYSL